MEIKLSEKRDLILFLKKKRVTTFKSKGHEMCLVLIGATLYFFGDLIAFRQVGKDVGFQKKIYTFFKTHMNDTDLWDRTMSFP